MGGQAPWLGRHLRAGRHHRCATPVELGYIDPGPVKEIRKPRPKRCESHVTAESFAELIANYEEGDPFRDLLAFCWYLSCRPQEAINLEPRPVQLPAECVVILKEEAKGKRRNQMILLQSSALEVVKRRLASKPPGKRFVNGDGRPWTRFAIANRFDRLVLAQGIVELKKLKIEIEPLPRFNRRKYKSVELVAARVAYQHALRDRRKQILSLAREHGRKVACYDLRHDFWRAGQTISRSPK